MSIRVIAFIGFLGQLVLWSASAAGQAPPAPTNPQRIHDGIQVLYSFRTPDDGSLIQDLAQVGQPLDLRIGDAAAVRRSSGGLEILKNTLIQSNKPGTRMADAIKQTGAMTIEAWIQPANASQNGPARIVTLSRNSTERDFTIGQDGDKFEVRFRTTKTNPNGLPGLTSKPKSLQAQLTHVVYTRSRTGLARLYLNGELNGEMAVPGEPANWDGQFHLAIANELTKDRPWLGVYHLVAIYSRDLSAGEVQQNFRAGTAIVPGREPATAARGSDRFFELRIAPLLANHCLECHDTHTRQGKLDLSKQASALAGGESGPAVVPGKAAESPIWQRVAANEMPHDRPPLSEDEKKLLRQWIEGGAAWSLDLIDPAVYLGSGTSGRVFVQRLTVPEYIATVRGTLGVEIAKEARELLPPDLRADGFSNTAYNLNVDLGHIEAYAKLAELIVQRIDIAALARKHTKSRELTDENVTKFVQPVGRLLLRGPLTAEEVQRYCGISTTVAGAGGGFNEALRFILEAMLQSPRFVYRLENQRGDDTVIRPSQYELATRLSYILWGGPPDESLLDAAEKQALQGAGLDSQVRRMLQDPRAIERARQFISEWLNLGRLDYLRPDSQRFPRWDSKLAGDMRRETLAFFDEIVWKQNRPVTDLLNAQITFVTPRLARHYGLPERNPTDSGGKPDELIRYDLSSLPSRGGLLTQGSVLTIGGDEASMVARGLFVMQELLRGVVRNPPPCVDTTPVPSQPGLSKRAIAESRVANKSCSGCHGKFEPLAFGLEKFDGLGAFHQADEHGNQLHEDGSILFPGQEAAVSYPSTAELMNHLAGSDRVRQSLTWKIAQFAIGRPLGAEDASTVAAIHRIAQQGGGTYKALITAIVLSDLVQTTRTE